MAGPQKQGAKAPSKKKKNSPAPFSPVLNFDSLTQYGAYVEHLHSSNHWGRNRTTSSQKGGDYDWDFNTSFEQALQITLQGGSWHKGAEQLAAVDVNPTATQDYAIKPAYEHSVVGGCVDVGEYLAGSPECMMGLAFDTPNTPVIKIRYIAIPCSNISADEMMNYGRAMLALIDALELKGYSVELVANIPFLSGGEGLHINITVKQAGQDWSAAAIAYAIAHPAFTRRTAFRVCEAFDETAEIRDCGYGSGRYDKPDDDAIHFKYLDRPSEVDTPENALTYALETAKQQRPDLFN